MPTNRTPINRHKFRITPQIVDLYRRAREIYDDDDAVNRWEEAGGRKGEFYDISRELHLALGRAPWEEDILDTIDRRHTAALVGSREEEKLADRVRDQGRAGSVATRGHAESA